MNKVYFTYIRIAPPKFVPTPVLHGEGSFATEIDLNASDAAGPHVEIRKYLATRDVSVFDQISPRSYEVLEYNLA